MRSIGFAVTVLLGLTHAASAQDISLSAPDALQGFLTDASLSMSLADDAEPAPQDYVAAARADYRRLLTALYAKGYYGGTISIRVNGQEASGIAPLGGPTRIDTIAISVTPGPQFMFGTAQVAPLPDAASLPPTFATGEPAEADVIRQAAIAGVEAWRDDGHAKADVAGQSIVARHSDRQLDATVTLAPGPRLTFGNLTIVGNENVRTGAIQNIAGLPVGAVFSPDILTTTARRLRETGAFDSVAVTEADTVGPDNTLPITVTVVEAKPRRFGFGLELSSVEGLKVSSYWLHRNAFGAAERFRIEGEIGGIGGGTGGTDYAINTSLSIPAIYGPDLDLLATASISREDEPDYLLDKAAIEVVAISQYSDDLTLSGGFGILAAREETALGVREYTLLTMPLSATLDRRDDPANPSNGYYIDVDATPFIDTQTGDSGGRIYADARGYISFGDDDRITLAARGQIGSVLGVDRDVTPADFLFYSGGSGSVRGQAYKSLGVTTVVDGEEVTTGGLSFAGAQIEARYGVTDSIGVVGFYDVGYVGAGSDPLTDGDWHSGLGLGVRYNTGIGPIRLDIGTPADGDNAFGAVEVYIGIGQAF